VYDEEASGLVEGPGGEWGARQLASCMAGDIGGAKRGSDPEHPGGSAVAGGGWEGFDRPPASLPLGEIANLGDRREEAHYRVVEAEEVLTPFQRHFNAISTPFQRHFNAISTPFQPHFNPILGLAEAPG